jgi:hypothetical protein
LDGRPLSQVLAHLHRHRGSQVAAKAPKNPAIPPPSREPSKTPDLIPDANLNPQPRRGDCAALASSVLHLTSASSPISPVWGDSMKQTVIENHLLRMAAVLGLSGLVATSACGDLPPLPVTRSLDGGSTDGLASSSEAAWDSAVNSAVDAPAPMTGDAETKPPVDASTELAHDSATASPLDASEALAGDARSTPIDASVDRAVDVSAVDAPKVPVCPAGYADCNGDDRDGCETALDTPGHCSSCENVCGAVANGSATCSSGKCTVKCANSYGDCDAKYDNGCETDLNSPSHCGSCQNACAAVANGSATCSSGRCTVKCNSGHKDCDGKYENGCEIPDGQADSCNESGLASFSGTTPPCGTAHCGSATTSGSVTNFGTWHCSFCVHCHHFSNGDAWCLYNPGNGNYSSQRSSDCTGKLSDLVCN